MIALDTPLSHTAVAICATDSLSNIGIRRLNSLQFGLWAVARRAETIACLVALCLGIKTVNGDEIVAGVGMGGAVTACPMDSVVAAGATAFSPVGTRRLGADGGWNRAEGLGGFVLGCHNIWWLFGASAPADAIKLTQRQVMTIKK